MNTETAPSMNDSCSAMDAMNACVNGPHGFTRTRG